MVSATFAYANQHEVVIKGPGGEVIRARRADLSDPDDIHGVDRDEADHLAEELGYLIGTWRWQPDRQHYRAVATKAGPRMTAEQAAEWQARQSAQHDARRIAAGNPRLDPGQRPASYGRRR